MKYNLDIQFFGGRGQRRSGGRGNTGGNGNVGSIKSLPLAGQTGFDDKGNTSVKQTLDYWENLRRKLDHEQALIVNEDGYAIGYFDGDKESVSFSIPKGAKNNTLTLTHVHPPFYDRTIGGGFSDADVMNHIRLGFKETRAVSIEGVYSFKTTSESNPKGFLKALKERKGVVSKQAKETIEYLTKNGYSLSEKEETDIYLKVSHIWYENTCNKYGYEYKLTKHSTKY